MHYLIKTYGCQMNVHESEKLAGILEDMNYKPCEKEEDADVILLGPQVRFELKKVSGLFPDKPVEVIDMKDYGMMNGQKVLEHALTLVK